MRRTMAFLLFVASSSLVFGQWKIQRNDLKVEFRGLSTVSNKIAWAGGTRNSWARTVDGGETWQVGTIVDKESLDFRDVEAFSANTAYLLSIGTGTKSRIYKTTDGGKTWSAQVVNPHPKAFLDGFAFWDERNGIAVGDPIDGKFMILRTADGGAHWAQVPPEKIPPALPGDGIFAASGTTIVVQGKSNVWFATGGSATARVFRSTDKGLSWSATETSVINTQTSTGIFSLAFRDAQNGILVGGDYRKVEEAIDNIAITSDGGRTWQMLKNSGIGGFRSCIAYLPGGKGNKLIAAGPSGSDYSLDGGWHWIPYDKQGFHVFSFARSGTAGWAAGAGGRIAKFTPLPASPSSR